MKKVLAFIVFTTTAFSSFAQTTKTPDPGKFSIGVDAAIPTGVASKVYDIGIGGSVKYEVPTAADLYFTLSAGYEVFLLKSESDGFVPLKVGLKYYFKKGIFGEAQAGVSIYAGKGGFTSFVYSPGIGYSFNGNFEIGARYEAWVKSGTMGQAALRLAYKF